MANFTSNRSPSPLSTRNCRNSETSSSTRRSFNGNPFSRPNAPTPANTPATTDHMKRGSIFRKSTGSSLFQDGKENLKDVIRSPAKGGSKGFMAPTISAASKFTPSPRKKVLGEKNEVARTSIQFLEKDFKLKPEETPLDQPSKTDEGLHESVTVEQKEVVLETPPVPEVVPEVNLISITDATEMLSDFTEDFDLVKIRPFCCSPQSSPIIAPLDVDPLPPYDPKKNFLSPRPQFLRYKPNPRIELLLNKVDGNDGHGEDDVLGLEDRFNLSDNSSDAEEEESKEKEEVGKEKEENEEVKLSDNLSETVFQEKQSDSKLKKASNSCSALDNLSEIVLEEKQSDSKLEKASKPRFFTRSKTVVFISVMFLVACFSVSFTDSPPMDLPIYKDVSFSEVYHESLKLAGFAKESVDDFVENLKHWSNDLVSYLCRQISHFGSTHSPIQFFNLTPSPIQEEFIFNGNIQTDYVDANPFEEIQEFEEEMEDEHYEMIEEEAYDEIQEFEEMDDEHYEMDGEDELLVEETHDDDLLQKSLNLEDGSDEIASVSVSKSEPISEIAVNDLEIVSTLAYTSAESEVIPEAISEMVVDDLEIESSSAESETLSSFSTRSINPIFLVGFSMVMVAISAIFYINKRRSIATTATVGVAEPEVDDLTESCSSETSVQKGRKKKASNNKRDSLASSSDFSIGYQSYGSFTTLERIPIKRRDEAMLTPIRRSSRLLKSQVTSS